MLRKNKEKVSDKPSRLPTVDEFLDYIPKRLDFEWSINKEGRVEIKVPKFKSNFGTSFCKFVRKENFFIANLDEIGSHVWKNCDGNTPVKKILEGLEKKFPNEKNIDQRLFLFLQQIKNLDYIEY